MTFLNTALLWGVLAASIPIIIHLINRRRHKTVKWAAMQFLLKATRESRGKKKLRHILILTCRALAIAALMFAAARPVVSGLLGWGGGSIDTVVLILDRSASMELRPGDGLEPRRAIVLERVVEAMKSLGGARLVLIDSATEEPLEVASPEVLAEISQTAATDTAADFPSLLTRAAEYLTETTGRAEVWLASDLQATNWESTEERWASARASLQALPQPPAIRVLALTGPGAPNSAISLLSSRRSGDTLVLELEIARDADARGIAEIPLTTQLDGARTTETLTLPAQSLRFQKRIALPADSETGHGWVSIPADGNPRDNVAYFAYGPDRPVRTAIVAAEGESASYLALAAAPPGYGTQQANRVDPAAAATLNTSELSAILWAAPLPTGPTASLVESFVRDGGHVMFLPPGGALTDSAFLGASWSPLADADRGSFFILQDWNRNDGLLRDGIDGTPVTADRLRAIRRQTPQGDTLAHLARWEDGEPFLSRLVLDRGTAWFLGSIPDYTWSNLGDADALLPAVQRLVTAGADRFDAGYLTIVGARDAQLFADETRTRLDDYGKAEPANAAHEAGIYRLGTRLLAVNRPAIEDDPEILTRERLDTVLEGTGHTLLEQAGQSNDRTLSRDVWRAFLFAMLLFLIGELLLCLPARTSESAIPAPAN
jgi:hypothetical protein